MRCEASVTTEREFAGSGYYAPQSVNSLSGYQLPSPVDEFMASRCRSSVLSHACPSIGRVAGLRRGDFILSCTSCVFISYLAVGLIGLRVFLKFLSLKRSLFKTFNFVIIASW